MGGVGKRSLELLFAVLFLVGVVCGGGASEEMRDGSGAFFDVIAPTYDLLNRLISLVRVVPLSLCVVLSLASNFAPVALSISRLVKGIPHLEMLLLRVWRSESNLITYYSFAPSSATFPTISSLLYPALSCSCRFVFPVRCRVLISRGGVQR